MRRLFDNGCPRFCGSGNAQDKHARFFTKPGAATLHGMFLSTLIADSFLNVHSIGLTKRRSQRRLPRQFRRYLVIWLFHLQS